MKTKNNQQTEKKEKLFIVEPFDYPREDNRILTESELEKFWNDLAYDYECEIEEVKKKYKVTEYKSVNDCTSLKELCDWLNYLDGIYADGRYLIRDVDISKLPKYGEYNGVTYEIYSWDEKYFLKFYFEWYLEERDDSQQGNKKN
jgi:hypothetical protein